MLSVLFAATIWPGTPVACFFVPSMAFFTYGALSEGSLRVTSTLVILWLATVTLTMVV